MEKEIEQLIIWYKDRKYELISSSYLDKSSKLKEFFEPYTDWDKAEVLQNEIKFNIRTIAKLKEQLERSETPVSKEALSIIILSLKNRTEFVSNQVDFFPVFITLILFTFTYLAMAQGPLFKVLIGLGTLVVVLTLTMNRIKARLRLAHTKELINILEAYKSNHS